MSESTYWLGRVAAFLAIAFFLLVGALLFSQKGAVGRVLLRTYERRLNRNLDFLRATITGRQLIALQAVLMAVCVAGALVSGAMLLLLGLPLIALFPQIRLAQQVARRTTLFDDQIEAWLGAISNSLRASPSLAEAIASTIPLVPAPMSEEVDILVKENELGTPLDRALDNLSARLNTKTIAATVLALKVARKSGGNLPEMLENAASALRELARLEGVVRTKTAEGRAQAWVIAAIPVPMVAGLHAMDPTFFVPLFNSFSGHFVMGVSGVLWLLAILAAQKILAVDV